MSYPTYCWSQWLVWKYTILQGALWHNLKSKPATTPDVPNIEFSKAKQLGATFRLQSKEHMSLSMLFTKIPTLPLGKPFPLSLKVSYYILILIIVLLGGLSGYRMTTSDAPILFLIRWG